MHHIYTGGKGDPLCPLGFHPQVRWPTRCKRCFRDYKEHGGKAKENDSSLRKDDITMSTPSLSWNSSRNKEENRSSSSASSSTDSGVDSKNSEYENQFPSTINSRFGTSKSLISSWTSTPDLGNLDNTVSTTVSITLPRRRKTSDLADGIDPSDKSAEFTLRRRTNTTDLSKIVNDDKEPEIVKARLDGSSSLKRTHKVSSCTNTGELLSPLKTAKATTLESKKLTPIKEINGKPPGKLKKPEVKGLKENLTNPDVEFILKVKSSRPEISKKTENLAREPSGLIVQSHGSGSSSGAEDSVEDDSMSVAGTETTETTLVDKNENELLEQIESLKNELDTMKARCERVEREKSDILLRRLASYDTTSSRTTASELLKLQQKVNELSTQSEDLKDDNKSLSLRVKELEKELDEQKKSDDLGKKTEELQAKLTAAETLCEELMDENEEMKKELRDLEDEIEEMQDNFREDQADEYSSLKKELEQTTKNCRILSFKLKKSERKAEQMEMEKLEVENKYKEFAGQKGLDTMEKVKKLENDLKVANEVATRLTKELEEANSKLKVKENLGDNDSQKKRTLFSSFSKPGEKVSRSSLTRGGSQEDPQQLLRDLQDSLEREADLREQLRFAEEEAISLRKKAARVEEENDSLALQLKKMAIKAKRNGYYSSQSRSGRKHTPVGGRLTPEPIVDKDEGISEEEDPTELRLMLELNEQESAVLRKKVEELESDSESHKRKIKELEEKLSAASSVKKIGIQGGLGSGASPLDKQKMRVIEEEVTELRKKVIEKEREIERLQGEVQISHKRPKGALIKSKSLDSPSEQQTLDLKKQLQLVEQEATILRSRITSLEADNEKLSSENKKLQLLKGSKKVSSSSEGDSLDRINSLETKLAESEKMIKELQEKLEKPDNTIKKVGLSAFAKSTEMDKLKKEIKAKTDELEKVLKDHKKIEETLKRLREDAADSILEYYKERIPKKPTDMHTKLQLKRMIEELENEVGDILVALKKSESEKVVESKAINFEEKEKRLKELEEKLEESKKKISKSASAESEAMKKLEKLLEAEKESKLKLEEEFNEKKERLKNVENERRKMEEEKKKLEAEFNKMVAEKDKWKEEKRRMESEIHKFELEKKNLSVTQGEVALFAKKLENANKEIDRERENANKLKKRVEEIELLEKECAKCRKEVNEKNDEIKELEKKLKDSEEKSKKLEKSLSINKSKINKLEKTVEDLEKYKADSCIRFTNIQKELDATEKLNLSFKEKISKLESDLEEKNENVKSLEESLRKERERATDASIKADSAEKREITSLREDLNKNTKNLKEANDKYDKLEKELREKEEIHKKIELELIKEKEIWESKASELDSDLNAERKKIERIKITHEKEQRNRETELSALKVKIRSLEHSSGASTKKVGELKDEYAAKIQKLESEIAAERQEYEDLTVKYDLLEEEHVVTKAQLVMEKEHIQSQVMAGKREIESLEKELKMLKESYNSKQEAWIKEKIDLQEKLKETTERITRTNENKWEIEKARLTAINEEQKSLSEQLKQQNDSVLEQMEHMRKENEELRKKLDDFDKVAKVQRQLTADTNQMELELRELRGRLAAEEKNHKSEMSAQRLRYESRVNLISEELQTSQSQVSRFKRERDTYRHMLEEAQSQMADLKSGAKTRDSKNVSSDEMEDSKTIIANLEQQVSCMEDELSEARLDCSKLKTELVSEKSAWEVKLSELQSRINELEEDKILSSGRTKIPGLRTRMELAWQKEREDQHRLLQETSTLARDLRQTLFEVERERDKERLEAKRRQEQMKRASEEEMEENRKKITELQCDLLELRDAHAKLRTTNEKLRREKERWDRESRSLQRSRTRTDDEERKIQIMLDNVDSLMKLLPHQKDSNIFDSPGKKKLSKSREASPTTAKPDGDEVKKILHQLASVADDIRSRNLDVSDKERDRNRRSTSIGFRRAASTESEGTPETAGIIKRQGAGMKKSHLHRKSLSLSDTAGPGAQDQAIWKEDDNEGSLTSLEEHVHKRLNSIGRREASMDSGMSGGSVQSDIVEKKKKKGLLGKLKKLTKSRSIEYRNSSQEDFFLKSTGGSDSDTSITQESEARGSKKDIREKLTGMFKRGGSSSRSNSVERNTKADDYKTKSLPRNAGSENSPATGSSNQNGATGRPLDRTKNPAASMIRKS